MNCMHARRTAQVRFRPELMRNASGESGSLKTRVLTGLFSALSPVDVTADVSQRVSVHPQQENNYIYIYIW